MVDAIAKVPTLPATGYVLWYRAKRRRAWEPVAAAPTEAEAVNAIGIGGRRNGHWIVLPIGREP